MEEMCPNCGACHWAVEELSVTDDAPPSMKTVVRCCKCDELVVIVGPKVEDSDNGEFGLGGDWWKQ